MPAPISLCMIARNDPHLDQCLSAIVPYVQEVNVVITSDKDTDSIAICQKYGARYQVFTDCNDDQDRIANFSAARNKSLEMASSHIPWLMWCDSDDIVQQAEKLEPLVNSIQIPAGHTMQIILPYDYGYDQQGNSTCRQYRERIVPNNGKHKFIYPVHEVLINDTSTPIIAMQGDVLFTHQRQFINKPQDPTRNLRILEKWFADGYGDTRTKYYIGLEYFNHNQLDKSTQYLSEYVKESGWDDEKAMALYKLVEICQRQAKWLDGLSWGFQLLQLKYNWFESYYALARMYYGWGKVQECVHYGELALAQPPTQTLLFVNQSERFEIHLFLNICYAQLNQIDKAYDSCQAGLKGLPQHPQLLNNERIYQQHLNIQLPITQYEASEGKLAIVFVTHPGHELWTPDSLHKGGIGGSETMLIHMARELQALGHSVTVFAGADGYFDGVHYLSMTQFRNLSCDVLVVSRYAHFLDDPFRVSAQLKLLWVHDVIPHGADNHLLLKADYILALSQWHKDFIVQHCNVHPDHVLLTRNAIDLSRFNKQVKRDPYKLINSSSPDRSWPVLLEMFPRIREKFPQTTLHLYYGLDGWKAAAANDPSQLQLIAALEEKVKTMSGVFYHGRVDQNELSEAFLSSQTWVHPTWFTETSCITAMEAQAAGCHIVSTDLAAISETCAGYDKTTLIKGNWTDADYQTQFIEAVCKTLT